MARKKVQASAKTEAEAPEKKESKTAARKKLIKKMKDTEAKENGKEKAEAPAPEAEKQGTLQFKAVDTTSESYLFYIDFVRDALLGKLRKGQTDRQRQAGAQIKRVRAALRSLPQDDVVEFIYGG